MVKPARVTDHGSLWAAVTPPGPMATALNSDCRTDALVIGAGFTGLSTAINLRKAGVETVIIEAAEPGWGASGRNNGQVIPTLSRPDPDDIEARHGEAGERFVRLLRDCANTLFATIREHGIAAEAEQTGWIQPVHSPGRIAIAERRVRQWAARGATVELLDRAQAGRMLGSNAWHGGFWNRSGGHLNPLALVRGLAHTAVKLGARLYIDTPATSVRYEFDQWVVETPRGRVRAKSLVLATGAYTAHFAARLAPDIAREVVPVVSWQLATESLPDAVSASVVPGRQAVSDTHGELYFMRHDARNRLISGGALITPINAHARLKTTVAARLQSLWPQLGAVRIDHVWNGFVGMTNDYMPRFHRLGPNGFTWVGCNGRAVGLSVALGAELARAVQGAREDELALPFTLPKPLPMHSLARRIAPLMLLRYRRLDKKEI